VLKYTKQLFYVLLHMTEDRCLSLDVSLRRVSELKKQLEGKDTTNYTVICSEFCILYQILLG
jgi:hypothetical protein